MRGVKIVQFNGPFYFANSDYFQTKLFKMSKVNPYKLKKIPKTKDNENLKNQTETSMPEKENLKDDVENDINKMIINNTTVCLSEDLRFIIVDCSAIIYMDKVAIRILDDVSVFNLIPLFINDFLRSIMPTVK